MQIATKKLQYLLVDNPKNLTFAPLSQESTFFEQFWKILHPDVNTRIGFQTYGGNYRTSREQRESSLSLCRGAEIIAAGKFSRKFTCGNSSVGRARPCQGRGREFESRLPLKSRSLIYFRNAQVAELVDAHVSGACAARCAGSSPVLGTSLERWRNW